MVCKSFILFFACLSGAAYMSRDGYNSEGGVGEGNYPPRKPRPVIIIAHDTSAALRCARMMTEKWLSI
ncbi:unnamed protein product [Nezara viridula]|uniref:Neuropeptide n=1 Tax=Nezara viridula TaxID=85310 RepID=A0A9P0DWE1_NEZVI|nr:unnamed protein product [Nezara viridula]